MDAKADEFAINLNLHHPSCDPSSITQEFSLEPWHTHIRGEQVGSITYQKTAWLCSFCKGSSNAEFEVALKDVTTLISTHEAFIDRFLEQGGEIELQLDSAMDVPEEPGDKIFELNLYSELLKQLGQKGIDLRIQVWKTASK